MGNAPVSVPILCISCHSGIKLRWLTEAVAQRAISAVFTGSIQSFLLLLLPRCPCGLVANRPWGRGPCSAHQLAYFTWPLAAHWKDTKNAPSSHIPEQSLWFPSHVRVNRVWYLHWVKIVLFHGACLPYSGLWGY